jgi:hypothetical protein
MLDQRPFESMNYTGSLAFDVPTPFSLLFNLMSLVNYTTEYIHGMILQSL